MDHREDQDGGHQHALDGEVRTGEGLKYGSNQLISSLFILIGEHLHPYSNQINGALIQKKRGKFKLAFWLKVISFENLRNILRHNIL